MDDEFIELDRRAGKAEKDDHPLDESIPTDSSDAADDRVVQPGEDGAREEASPDQGRT